MSILSQFRPVATLPRGLNQLPYPRRRERKLARLDPERGERGGDRIGNDATNRNDAALACTLGAERIGRRGLFFERHCADRGKVAGAWEEIVRERAGQQLSVRIVD